MSDLPVQFFIPPYAWPSAEILSGGASAMVRSFTSADWMWNHSWHWTLQTYFWLRESGCPVQLVKEMPDEGIVVICSGEVAPDFRPGRRQFLVSINGDEAPDCHAQMRITQNRIQTRLIAGSHYVPLWPQPGLVRRAPARGDTFSSIAYFGDDMNIAPELRSADWMAFLAERGLRWNIRNAESPRNADFSDVDVVIGVRSFRYSGYIHKPASKLVNAWIAGVPAILGREIAFREQRRSAVDYLEVASLAETRDAIDRLAASPALRRSMVENGTARAEEFTVARLTAQWRHMLFDLAQEAAARWSARSPASHGRFFLRRQLERKLRGGAHRLLKALGQEQYAI
jgi:hypothetical protein